MDKQVMKALLVELTNIKFTAKLFDLRSRCGIAKAKMMHILCIHSKCACTEEKHVWLVRLRQSVVIFSLEEVKV